MKENYCSADDVIITDRLSERPVRDPDYAVENLVIEALATELAECPGNLLQKLADTIVELGIGDSAGISIEEMAKVRQFRWVALAGVWGQLRGSTTPFDASPCGLAVRRDQLLLIESPERFFAEARVEPLIHEGLLLPFHIEGKPVGTLWVNAHNSTRKFDREDARLLKSLARFASAGFRTVQALEEAQVSKGELEQRLTAQVAELKTSEEKYRTLFETMGQGYGEVEIVRDPDGRAVDHRYIEINSAYERLVGIPAAQARGRLASEIIPGLEPSLHERFDRIARGGVPEQYEVAVGPLDSWFSVFAYPRDEDRLILLYEDVTERKRAQRMMRESEERQAFLLTLSDALRTLADPVEVLQTAMRLVKDHYAVDSAVYHEFDADGDYVITREGITNDRIDMPVLWRLGDFGFEEDLKAGRTIWYGDTETDPRLQGSLASYRATRIRSGLGVTLMKGCRLVAMVGLTDSEPRAWSKSERRLLEEVADRSWEAVGRARAEAGRRASEEQRRVGLEGGRMGAWRWDLPSGLIWGDAMFLGLWGFPPSDEPCALKDFTARMTPEGAREMSVIVAKAVETEESFEGDLEIINGPTVGHWVRWRGRADAANPGIMHGVSFDITEQRYADVALKESEQRFRAFVTASSDVVYRMSPDWSQMHELAGRGFLADTSEPNASWMETYINPADQNMVAAAIRDAIRSKSMFELEHRVRQADDSVGWTLSRAVPILGEEGEIAEWLGTASDVTERRRVETALRVSEERLRQFGEASQDVLWIRDAATLQWTYLTPAFEMIYGLNREQVLSGDDYRNWQDLIVPDDRAHAVASIERVLAGEWVTFEYRVQRPSDGAIRWLRNTDFPIVNEIGKVVSIGGVGHDMTDLKAVQAAIAESEERLRTLMEGIPQLVWRSCAEGRWTWASLQWLDFTGQRQEETHSLGWLDVVHPEDHAATLRAWDETKTHGRLDVEYRVRRAVDGAWLWHHTRSVPVRDADGTIVEWLGTTTDVHALRELQERQKVLVAELQHRTRNLITVVRSLSDRTVSNAASLDDFKGRFGRRLAALSRVQGLLSHLSAGERVDFDELLRSELTALGVVDGKAERVTLDGPSDVPLRSATVQTLALAVHELATNAVKYGALSGEASDAHLTVRWRVDSATGDDAPLLHVEWRESGVTMPQIGAPARGSGYGRELIERALPYQLGAETTYVLGDDGVRCTIEMPISREGATLE